MTGHSFLLLQAASVHRQVSVLVLCSSAWTGFTTPAIHRAGRPSGCCRWKAAVAAHCGSGPRFVAARCRWQRAWGAPSWQPAAGSCTAWTPPTWGAPSASRRISQPRSRSPLSRCSRYDPFRSVLWPALMIPTAPVEAGPMLSPSAVHATTCVTPAAEERPPAAGRRAAVGCRGELGDVRGVSVAAEPRQRRSGRGNGGGAAAAHYPPALAAGSSASRRRGRRRQAAAFPACGIGQRRGGCVPPVPQGCRDPRNHTRCGTHSCSSCCCISYSVPRNPYRPACSCNPGTGAKQLPAASGRSRPASKSRAAHGLPRISTARHSLPIMLCKRAGHGQNAGMISE